MNHFKIHFKVTNLKSFGNEIKFKLDFWGYFLGDSFNLNELIEIEHFIFLSLYAVFSHKSCKINMIFIIAIFMQI